MNLGFIKIFLLFVVVLVIGGFAFLVLKDVPVQQQEVILPITEAPIAAEQTPTPVVQTTPAPAVAEPDPATEPAP